MFKQDIDNSIKIQQQASNPQDSIYLAASAGTGKTKTLIDRIFRLLLNGVKIESILCLTFTNAAANEVLERLRDKFEHWSLISDAQLRLDIQALTGEEVTRDELKRAKNLYAIYLDNFDKFRIETLHAFCVKVLKQAHCVDENELDQVRIMDEYTKQKLVEKAYEKAVMLSHKNIEIDIAVSKLGQKYDYNSLLQLLNDLLSQKQKLYNFINSQASIQDLINEQYKFYGANRSKTSANLLDSFVQEEVAKLKQLVRSLICEDEETIQKINAWLNGDIQFKKDNLREYLNCFLTKGMTSRVRLPFSKEFENRNPNFIELYKKEQQRVENFFKEKTTQEQSEFMQCVIVFLNQIILEYEKLKEEHRYLEYDDLVLKTLKLFSNTNDMESLLFSLNLFLSHILIDEAQDLSKTQWLLINKIIAGITGMNSTVFIVGDYKQSVYGFQGAEPEYFLGINEVFKAKFHQKQKPWKNLELTHSFRSKKEILKAVDKVLNIRLGVNLNHIAIKEGIGKVQVIEHSYEEPKKVKQSGWVLPQIDEKVIAKKQYNSEEVADFVIRLLTSGAKPQDVMVLFRKRSERVSYFVEALKEKNIPVSEINKIDFRQNIAILDLLSLIKFFLLPEDDLNLAALLKSPFFNFTEEDIFKITYNRGENSVWDMLQNLYAHTASLLIELKDEYKNHSLHQFYTSFLYTCRFIYSVEYSEGYEEVIDPFLDKVLEFENKYHKRGQSFLEWIKYNLQTPIENNNTQGVNVITAHAAKGLESPIIIIADASESENLPVDTHFWHNDQLIIPYSSEYEIEALAKAKKERRKKAEGESLRLFYVAMTRAENELYIFGDAKGKKDSWYNIAKSILSENSIQYKSLAKAEHKFDITDNKEKVEELPCFLKANYIAEKIIQHQIASEKEQLHSDLAIIQGNFIHKVLYDIPKITKQKQALYIRNLGNTLPFDIIPSKEVNDIIKITKHILQKFPNIFYGDNILSEVSMQSNIDGSVTSVKIDKLIINKNSIDIIDIKTDKARKITSDTIPFEYRKQLEIYKKSVASMYPNKQISCKLLSFYQQRLIVL